MIEISDEKYWKRMNYYDGLLYLSLLEIDGKNDWRMFKDEPERDNIIDHNQLSNSGASWFIEDVRYFDEARLTSKLWWIIPVRDGFGE